MNITITNDLDNIGIVHDRFTDYASRIVRNEAIMQKLSIVIDEVLSNIISYGYTDSETHEIHVTCEIANAQVKLQFKDDGIPFNPLKVFIPEVSLVGENPPIGGLGIKLMKNLVDNLEYQRNDQYNELQITKFIP